jgi:asparagine synthase (glutamine-hydrolysing)
MCGIAGILDTGKGDVPDELQLRCMLASIRHRGPDDCGIYLAPTVALGSVRLSIIDLEGGRQPICNEDKSLWIVFNGEIFNYVELRAELESRGHRFSTHTDTEVILHLFEESGPECLRQLNGQFAFALWNERDSSLFLARDRLGVRPLFYTNNNGVLIFGSEVKAIACHPSVKLEIDPVALNQVFTYWSAISPMSVFRGIRELSPGSYLTASQGQCTVKKYWEMDFPCGNKSPSDWIAESSEDAVLESFRELLVDAVKIRLRADVPVGAYLSGGLDSSVIAYIIRHYGSTHLDTFSVSFDDNTFDESVFQKQMAGYLGTDHQVVHARYSDIGKAFPEVIWHTETPVLRTAPAPMFLLSQLVQENRYKVVLTGEGADEFLAGYDIFKEAKIRRYWARQPTSNLRPRLFSRIYKDIPRISQSASGFTSAFFKVGLTDLNSPYYSHAIRWNNSRRTRRFFSREFIHELPEVSASGFEALAVPPEFSSWGPLEQSQYWETTTFLSPYLLSSQGDRVAMAHSIEGRYPFLDHRVVEFCNRLPAHFKLRGLMDKYLLRNLAKPWLPAEIRKRPKRPYRAPVHRSFFSGQTGDYVHDVLSPDSIKDSQFFDSEAVIRLVRKIEQGMAIGETEDMALTGIISTQLLYRQFVKNFHKPDPLLDCDMKICRGPSLC